MFSADRSAYRRAFVAAWGKASTRQPLEPMEAQIVQVARMHPEYHPLLEGGEQALERDFQPEQGESNPFLHMALHIAILEQLSIDRPEGVRALYQRLVRAKGDAHAAEHVIMECLAEMLWTLQREQGIFDETAYFTCIERACTNARH